MIIKLIPETEAEKQRTSEVEITNVREFFIMGNNVTEDGNYNEFHEWTGSYRYLYGTLQYYTEVINDERRDAHSQRRNNTVMGPQLRIIEPEADDLDDEDADN